MACGLCHKVACRRTPVARASACPAGAQLRLAQQQQPQQQASAAAQPRPWQLRSAALALLACAAALSAAAGPAAAAAGFALPLEIHQEPANALSLPTWAIHVSSVVEWLTAMNLMWQYAEVSGNARWKGMAWGMTPLLGGAMCACTWHFFYNSPDLDWLVALQAFLTIAGNTTCWIAAYRIYAAAQQEKTAGS